METIERYYDQPQIVTKPEYYPVDGVAAGADDSLLVAIVRRWRTALAIFCAICALDCENSATPAARCLVKIKAC